MLRGGVPEMGVDGYRETMDAVGRLAGKVAHHLNNLLTVVEDNASYLEEELEDPRFAPGLRDIREACGRASELSTQLLSISGCRWCEPHTVDLRTLVSGMDLGRFFSDDVEFRTDFVATTCRVRVDPAHLEEVVVGLVLNAREAVGGHGTVRVGIDHIPGMEIDGSPATGWVQLEVSDSGPGMDWETLSRAFQPFFSTRPFSEDRGMGLSVACGIVRQSGGTMKISSAPGCGTTVRVWLPANDSVSVWEGPGWAELPGAPPAEPARSRSPSSLQGGTLGSPMATGSLFGW
jgi:signal transduction histidine kinase